MYYSHLLKFKTSEYVQDWSSVTNSLFPLIETCNASGTDASQDSDVLNYYEAKEGYMPLSETTTDLRNLILTLMNISTFRRSKEILELTVEDFNNFDYPV